MIETDFCVFTHLHFHPGLFVQNMGLAAGHCGQAHVKKKGIVFIIFALHQRFGYRGIWAPGKPGLTVRWDFAIGFTI